MQHSASTSASQPSILRNKRTRIGETSIIQPKSNSDKDRLLATFESGCLNLHEAARDSEQTVRFKNDFIKDLLKFQKQKERSNRLLEDNFIPKNIALKVALTGTPEISNTDEFKSIQGRASIALQEYQKKMKELMVETATLEIETTMKSQQETVYNFTRELFLDSLLLEGASEDTDDDNRMESLAEVMTEAVLDDESFSKIYFGRVKSFERQDGTSEKIASYRAAIERNQSCVNDVKKQMHKILVATVELHQEIILNQLTHDAIAKRRSKTQAAADVNNIQMNVDQAMASMDVDTMNDLVDRRIMEIEKAKKEKAKNSKRGATKKSSASSKKKKKKNQNEQQKNGQGHKGKDTKRDSGNKKSKKSKRTGQN
ncbi:predicted protein [Chaetoceros tenuissimus]|uniref:Uncharacterized protein n=1 Tax=Chaetoceros tenuissimus TaxID=426638 RepID=A0AAD3H2P0_9STRA|nr:predicted protein [Chaetoceros tenuissimus]